VRIWIEILMKDRGRRTPEDVLQLMKLIKKNKFFEIFSDDVMGELCRCMSWEAGEAGEYLFEEGDVGSTFYIVMYGGVQIFRWRERARSRQSEVETLDSGSQAEKRPDISSPKEGALKEELAAGMPQTSRGNTPEDQFMELLQYCTSGTSFGEIALVDSTGCRHANAKVAVPSGFVTLSEKDFRQVLLLVREKEDREKVDFFCRVSIFSQCTLEMLRSTASTLEVQHLPSKSVLLDQGAEPSDIFFIMSGEVDFVVDIPAIPDVLPVADKRAAAHAGLERRPEGLAHAHVLLTTLGPGEYFGDQAILCRQPQAFYAISKTEVTVLKAKASDFDFFKSLNSKAVSRFEQRAQLLPSIADIQHQFAALTAWQRQKKGILHTEIAQHPRVEVLPMELWPIKWKCTQPPATTELTMGDLQRPANTGGSNEHLMKQRFTDATYVDFMPNAIVMVLHLDPKEGNPLHINLLDRVYEHLSGLAFEKKVQSVRYMTTTWLVLVDSPAEDLSHTAQKMVEIIKDLSDAMPTLVEACIYHANNATRKSRDSVESCFSEDAEGSAQGAAADANKQSQDGSDKRRSKFDAKITASQRRPTLLHARGTTLGEFQIRAMNHSFAPAMSCAIATGNVFTHCMRRGAFITKLEGLGVQKAWEMVENMRHLFSIRHLEAFVPDCEIPTPRLHVHLCPATAQALKPYWNSEVFDLPNAEDYLDQFIGNEPDGTEPGEQEGKIAPIKMRPMVSKYMYSMHMIASAFGKHVKCHVLPHAMLFAPYPNSKAMSLRDAVTDKEQELNVLMELPPGTHVMKTPSPKKALTASSVTNAKLSPSFRKRQFWPIHATPPRHAAYANSTSLASAFKLPAFSRSSPPPAVVQSLPHAPATWQGQARPGWARRRGDGMRSTVRKLVEEEDHEPLMQSKSEPSIGVDRGTLHRWEHAAYPPLLKSSTAGKSFIPGRTVKLTGTFNYPGRIDTLYQPGRASVRVHPWHRVLLRTEASRVVRSEFADASTADAALLKDIEKIVAEPRESAGYVLTDAYGVKADELQVVTRGLTFVRRSRVYV
ncbi:hypothetical protein CYMTET_15959, partial [Cymbomonas tetramitiformis]